MSVRRLIAVSAAVAVGVGVAGAATAATPGAPPVAGHETAKATKRPAKKRPIVLVKTMREPGFGSVLATRRGRALYWWTRDGRNRVRCTGSCAVAWPPLIVPRNRTVPRRIRGIRGRFGVVRRPDGRRQVTYQGYPIYTYVNEGPGVVGCDNVNGWFVARARGLR